MLGRRPPVLFTPMDNILRNLENLSRTELVWLNTYLAGRLRALPPENEPQPPVPKAAPNEPANMPGPTEVAGPHGATVAPLPERIDALNYSLDPWERTGAVPQGWATHLHQAMVPIQGYIQLKLGGLFLPSALIASLLLVAMPSLNQGCSLLPGKASPSVSIFSRDPLCKNTCRYCRCRPCDVGVEHDDHTCYSCEQHLLHPDGVPGARRGAQCTSQRCAVRGLHELHVCMGCEHTMKFSTPVGGGDPWAAPE